MADPRPIGVFDSGLGGLTVLTELVRALPAESYIYLGDTARLPYGAKSSRTIQRYSQEVAARLLEQNIKLLVIACNTASAHAESLLRSELAIPVLGVIQPGVDALLAASLHNRVGVIGTRSTIKSGVYEQRIRARKPEAQIFSKACPLFVPLVEEGWIEKRITQLVIEEYLSEMVREEVDAVALGCTHYPLLKKAIHNVYPALRLVDSSEEIARQAASLLASTPGLAAGTNSRPQVRIELTDLTEQMNDLERLLSGLPVSSVEEIQLSAAAPH
ncbi:MAG: glutamate racemase [Leptospirales bacterium]|nr:glutamate racemase [Leptospirales bacterium]